MKGGFLQLATRGIKDKILIDNPQITFFKKVYLKYFHFGFQYYKQNFNLNADFGSELNLTIDKYGDLIGKIILEFELNDIILTEDVITDINYVIDKKNVIDKLKNEIDKMNDIKNLYIKYFDFQIQVYQKIQKALLTDNITLEFIKNTINNFFNINTTEIVSVLNQIAEKEVLYQDEIKYPKISNQITSFDLINYINNYIGNIDNNFKNNINQIYDKIINYSKIYFNRLVNKEKIYNDLNSNQINLFLNNDMAINLVNNIRLNIDNNNIYEYNNYGIEIKKDQYLNIYQKELYDNIINDKKIFYLPLSFDNCFFLNNYLPIYRLEKNYLDIVLKLNNANSIYYLTDYQKEYNEIINPIFNKEELKYYNQLFLYNENYYQGIISNDYLLLDGIDVPINKNEVIMQDDQYLYQDNLYNGIEIIVVLLEGLTDPIPIELVNIYYNVYLYENPNTSSNYLFPLEDTEYLNDTFQIIYHHNIIDNPFLLEKYFDISQEDSIILFNNFQSNQHITLKEYILMRQTTNSIYLSIIRKKFNKVNYLEINKIINNFQLKSVNLISEYVFLNEDAKRYLDKVDEYMITQYNYQRLDLEKTKKQYSIDLDLYHPIKEIFIYIRKKSNEIDINFSKKNFVELLDGKINNLQFIFNGYTLLPKKVNDIYYQDVIPWKYNYGKMKDKVYYYSFSLYPNKYQPSGFLNLTYFKEKKILLEILTDENLEEYQIEVICNNYNFIVYQDNRAWLKFN